jgi:drug/metabolite transporter (DMT)-like permease
MGFALLILLATTNLRGLFEIFHDTRASIGLVVGLGFCGTGLAFMAYYVIVNRLGAIAASGVTYIPPVVALIIGVALVGEPVQLVDIAATVAILAGVGILQSGRTIVAAKA